MMNLICPDCKEEMVRYRYENPEGDWIFGWICGCNEETRKNRQSVSKPDLSAGLGGANLMEESNDNKL